MKTKIKFRVVGEMSNATISGKYMSDYIETYEEAEKHVSNLNNTGTYQIQKIYIRE